MTVQHAGQIPEDEGLQRHEKSASQTAVDTQPTRRARRAANNGAAKAGGTDVVSAPKRQSSSADAAHKPKSSGNAKTGVHKSHDKASGSSAKPESAQRTQHAKSKKSADSSNVKQASGKELAKKRKRRKNIMKSSFYRVYFVVVAVCLVGIVALMVWLHGGLKDYEIVQPIYVAQEAIKLFENADYASLYDYDTTAASADSREQYVQRMNELTRGGQISWGQGYTSEADLRVYDVRLNGERFARLSLVPSDRTTEHGNHFWTLDSITTYVTMHDPTPEPTPEPTPDPNATPTPEAAAGFMGRITVPFGYKVSVNSNELGDEDVVRTGVPAVAVGLLPAEIPNPTLTEYEFYSELESPSFNVTDANGVSQTVREDSTHIWSCGLPEDEFMKQQFSDQVVTMAEGIARCAARTLRKGSLLPYCVENSPAYLTINAFDDATGLTGRRYEFENVVVSDFYRYTDEFFSAHVSFDYMNYYAADNIKRDATSITLYFEYKDNVGKLYSFTMY